MNVVYSIIAENRWEASGEAHPAGGESGRDEGMEEDHGDRGSECGGV